MLGVEFANFKISRAAECYRTCMAKSFPKPLRTLYRGCGTRTSNRFTSDDAAIDVIERHDHELGNFGYTPFLPNRNARGDSRAAGTLASQLNERSDSHCDLNHGMRLALLALNQSHLLIEADAGPRL